MLRSQINIASSTFKRSPATVKIITRSIVTSKSKRSLATAASSSEIHKPQGLSFPCLDKLDKKTDALLTATKSLHGNLAFDTPSPNKSQDLPEPVYARVQSGFKTFKSNKPILLDYGGVLPEFEIAYEHWGELNEDKSNAILLHTGLSASSHAKSQPENTKPGWWEKFIGPGKPLDTSKYFVICTNVIGGCYGSTGPSSVDPFDGVERYATRFPILSLNDMVRAQERLVVEGLGISKLYASVGSSMGGMQSLAFAQEFPDKVSRVVSISGCARSHPYSIAMRHTQRQVLMSDPNWKRGFYYDSVPPHVGMKLSREIATVTYRSGPEWEIRFGRERSVPSQSPVLCPDFLVETYLDHQGNKFSLEYDPNSLLYISKAMDLFDLGLKNRLLASEKRIKTQAIIDKEGFRPVDPSEICPVTPKQEENIKRRTETKEASDADLREGMKPIADKKVLVIGVKSDILFPHWQQLEVATRLREANIKYFNGDGSNIKHVELGEDISMFGHDTFLLDLEHVGGPIKEFLE